MQEWILLETFDDPSEGVLFSFDDFENITDDDITQMTKDLLRGIKDIRIKDTDKILQDYLTADEIAYLDKNHQNLELIKYLNLHLIYRLVKNNPTIHVPENLSIDNIDNLPSLNQKQKTLFKILVKGFSKQFGFLGLAKGLLNYITIPKYGYAYASTSPEDDHDSFRTFYTVNVDNIINSLENISTHVIYAGEEEELNISLPVRFSTFTEFSMINPTEKTLWTGAKILLDLNYGAGIKFYLMHLKSKNMTILDPEEIVKIINLTPETQDKLLQELPLEIGIQYLTKLLQQKPEITFTPYMKKIYGMLDLVLPEKKLIDRLFFSKNLSPSLDIKNKTYNAVIERIADLSKNDPEFYSKMLNKLPAPNKSDIEDKVSEMEAQEKHKHE